MKLRTLKLLVAGVLSTSVALAGDAPKAMLPAPLPAPKTENTANQKLADKVAKELGGMPAAATADVKVMTESGVVTVTGTCKKDGHKKAILQTVSLIEGVTLVRDGLKVEDAAPAALPTLPAPTPTVKQTQALDGGPRLPPVPSAMPPSPTPIPGVPFGPGGGGAGMAGDPNVEPLPLGQAGGGGGMGGSPAMPPYAWPTYAPYPNMSRVGYPTAYPYNAFPYIGPFYPFPKVPLGWRSVTMSWEDGHWWLGRKQSPQDYWKVKFGY